MKKKKNLLKQAILQNKLYQTNNTQSIQNEKSPSDGKVENAEKDYNFNLSLSPSRLMQTSPPDEKKLFEPDPEILPNILLEKIENENSDASSSSIMSISQLKRKSFKLGRELNSNSFKLNSRSSSIKKKQFTLSNVAKKGSSQTKHYAKANGS